MIIQCTKKVFDKIGMKDAEKAPDAPTSENEKLKMQLHSWHVNLLTIDRRKVLLFLNDLYSVSVIVYRPQVKDYKHLNEILCEGIETLMRRYGVKEDVIRQYLEDDELNCICRSSSRSVLARMNQFGNAVSWTSLNFRDDRKVQINAMLSLMDYTTGTHQGYKTPDELFIGALAELYGDGTYESVRDRKSYVLDIRLDIEGHDIHRVVEVPALLTFSDLHRVIKTTFGWFDYHCHCFDVMHDDYDPDESEMNGPGHSYNTRLYIYDSDDRNALDFLDTVNYEVIGDRRIMLDEVFEEDDWCLYTYDFGDNWEHIITVKERKAMGGVKRAVMLERQGERPPEDVGGEYGYNEYLRIINDTADPEYDHILNWSKITRAEEKTDEEINRSLSWIK